MPDLRRSWQMEIAVPFTLEKVTVYPDRARVTCVGACALEQGQHHLTFAELPLTLETESVRVTGGGTARVRILGVDVRRQFYAETPAARVRELELAIEQVEDDLRVLADELAGWQAQAQHVDGLRQATTAYAKGLARGRTTVTDQAALAQFLHAEDQRIRAAQREVALKQRGQQRQLQKLREEINALKSTRPRQRYAVQVEVEALTAGEFAPALSYVVGSAGWQPLYDLRLQTDAAPPAVAVEALAQITQSTGQDWEGVQLVVSTARPALNQRLPELKPWYIDLFVPQPRPQVMRAMRLEEGLQVREALPAAMAALGTADDGLALATAAETAVAELQSGDTAVRFVVPGRVDIPSDGSPHKTALSHFSLAASLDYLAVPRHTDAVYRRARVTNEAQSPLLAGAANMFVGDEFIGATQLDYTPAGGELKLLLGVEERITVKRELARRDVDKRLLRDERQIRYGYTLKVENLLATPAQVELHDQIPVARHEQIKVKLDNATPAPSEHSDLNLLKWRLALDAGAARTVTYEYVVEHPRSVQVVGLVD
jgi:uncharacterized protein (TIGR02231 family)